LVTNPTDIETVIHRYINNLVLYKYRTSHKQKDGINKYYLQSTKLSNATVSFLT